MTGKSADTQSTGRIEGGIDAIVIGANADGLAAAAYLGKAGLHTVLLEESAEIGGPVRAREIAPGVTGVDGEHLVTIFDPDVITELDLYRFGVAYASRRLDSVYFQEDGQILQLDGDLQHAANLLSEEDGQGAFESFMQNIMALAAYLRPAFTPITPLKGDKTNARRLEKLLEQATPELSARIMRYAIASVEEVLNKTFPDGPVKTILTSEAAFLSGAAPHEAFSFMGLIRRLAGEAAGLQGAIAFPAGGAVTIIDALRRAAQAAKVEIRAATRVKSILIEWDRVAGVMLDSGGQLRAPIVINAMDASRAFLDMIGPAAIDIEFQHVLTAPRSYVTSARFQSVLKGVASDEATKENMTRRLVYAPPPYAVRRAFIDARAGRIPEDLIIEAIFPAALDPRAAVDGRQLLSAVAHPLPFDETPDEARRKAIGEAIISNIEKMAPGIKERLEAPDLRIACDHAAATGASAATFAAKPGIMQQWALAGVAAAASDICGFYFCGPEAQIGAGLSCSAGRTAAKAALYDAKKGDIAA